MAEPKSREGKLTRILEGFISRYTGTNEPFKPFGDARRRRIPEIRDKIE